MLSVRPRSSHASQAGIERGPSLSRVWFGAGGHDRMEEPDERKCHEMRLRQKKSLLDQAGEYVEAVRPQIESAVDKAMDYVEHTALPLLHEARDKAAPGEA